MHISKISPFISETISINGVDFNRTNFIPHFIKYDNYSEDVRLYFNDVSAEWLIRVKNGLPKLISRFVVEACLIVDAVGPGSCSALSVFLKGSTKPLIFSEGIITSSDLRKQTQYHQKGLTLRNRDYYYESFIRAICMCNNVFFLTLPKHAGWNNTPDGRRIFVSAENMIPILSDFFYDEKE
ncbi:hypothetical protein [Ruminococcus sp.]|uniref:hypothetical protein n=1 Tax=Ruminococcus sp. TaxID=41978 RepID=UPI0025FBE96C|nr:hypothetical protein [Ruminococcus sp.]